MLEHSREQILNNKKIILDVLKFEIKTKFSTHTNLTKVYPFGYTIPLL
jgi:hypothetical protein